MPALAVFLLCLCTAGCMFNIVAIRQLPTTLTPVGAEADEFTLVATHEISIGTGFKTKLKANTRWRMIGSIPEGAVYASKDQVLTVEASDICEAALVLDHGAVAGFYLVVEKTFCPAKSKVQIR